MTLFPKEPNIFQIEFDEFTKNQDLPQILECLPVVIWDRSKGFNAELTLTMNVKLTVVGLHHGCYGSLDVIQGGAGGWSIQLPADSVVVNNGQGVLTLTSIPGAVDTLNFKHGMDEVLKWTILPNFT